MRDFRIQLNEITFLGPDEISNEIQILRIGTFFHEGTAIEITKKHLKHMVSNFDKKVRGIEIMLDFSHESDKEAAAWFQELYLLEDGKELWAKVDWTEDGAESIRKKKYKYISADFNFAYKDNETLKDHGPTLLGAGLTNRPVVKKMEPTILSEHNTRENKMELEEMKKKLAALQEENDNLKKKIAEKDKGLSESKIKEREEAVAKKEKTIEMAEKKVKEDKVTADKKEVFDKMLSEGKSCEAQRDAYMGDDMKTFIENAPKAGTLNLHEKGNGAPGKDNKFADAQDEIISLAEAKVKEDKSLSLEDAQSQVLSEKPELEKRYRKETEE